MAAWLRKGPSPFHTPLAMIGVKAGQRLLVVGAGDVALAAELALVTGLNGLTLVVDAAPDAAARIETAAQQAGALIDSATTMPGPAPSDEDEFDVAVFVRLASIAVTDRPTRIADALGLLRPGGRLMVLDGVRRAGLLGGFREKGAVLTQDDVIGLLVRSGAVAARRLADADGVAYYEARKPQGAGC